MNSRLLSRAIASALVLVFAFASQANAAVEIFLKLSDVQGESVKVPGAIDILSYNHDIVHQIGSIGGGGGGAGKLTVGDLVLVKPVDKSSPKMMEACANGKHFSQATIQVRKSGKKPKDTKEYLVITLEDVIITSYQTGGSSSDIVPTDQFSLNYSKIKFSYRFDEEAHEIPINFRSVTVE